MVSLSSVIGYYVSNFSIKVFLIVLSLRMNFPVRTALPTLCTVDAVEIVFQEKRDVMENLIVQTEVTKRIAVSNLRV